MDNPDLFIFTASFKPHFKIAFKIITLILKDGNKDKKNLCRWPIS